MTHEAGISAAQIEFLAEDEPITIFPNFRMPEMYFIKGAVGPFQPAVPIEVPLWLALVLKKRKKCKIQPPAWLDAEFLSDKVGIFERENHDDGKFEAVHFHYMEIATLLLNNAADDIRNAPLIRATIEDIWNRRASKARDGLRTIGAETSGITMNNLSAMEINKIRPFIKQVMNQFYLLSQKSDDSTQDQ